MKPDVLPLVVAGGGAAGRAAARTLHAALLEAQVETPILHLTGPATEAIDRTMVDKAIMTGRLSPAHAVAMRPPLEGVHTREDLLHTVAEAAAASRTDLPGALPIGIPSTSLRLTLSSGETLVAGGLVVATGSQPNRLDVLGADDWAATGRISTLHSVDDALRIRELLEDVEGARVLVTGSGLVGAEAASLLTEAGHHVTLVARSVLPGASAWGANIAQRLASIHDDAVDAQWGARIISLEDGFAVLDNGTNIEADLVVVAHGASPRVPEGVPVFTDAEGRAGGVPADDRLRVPGIGASVVVAGAVAQHGVLGSGIADGAVTGVPRPFRIDHWDDSEAQGVHAAQSLLHTLGLAGDPGPYRSRSPWSARIHGHQLAGFGHPLPGSVEHVVTSEPLLVEFIQPDQSDGSEGPDVPPARPVSAVVGLDAGKGLREHARATILK